MKLYTYFRSSASYRVRIALALKGIAYEPRFVHLTRDGGEHRKPEFRAVNPQMRVPTLELDDGTVLVQSGAILQYIEDAYPEPPLLPGDPVLRARIRGVCDIIGCDIHPLNNSGTLEYLRNEMRLEEPSVQDWYAYWIHKELMAVEALIAPGPYAFGGQVTLADTYIVPQVANAHRFKVPLDGFPNIVAVDAACREQPAFQTAAPANQPDAE